MVSVREIQADDGDRIGAFLHAHLNPRVPSDAWRALVVPPWGDVGPNHGFQLVDDREQVVGAYLAVYSAGTNRPAVCNLAAFCVLEEHRSHSLRLVRALLRQKGYLFTDLSPSGAVPSMNERLGFRHLDTAARLVVNMPHPGRRAVVTDDSSVLTETLVGHDAVVHRDHLQAGAARHALVVDGGEYAYLLYRRDRRKRLPVFASPLHVGGSAAVLERHWPAVATHLAKRGFVATLAERRVLGFTPAGLGRDLHRPRPKMYLERGGVAEPAVDYLYSELTLIQW